MSPTLSRTLALLLLALAIVAALLVVAWPFRVLSDLAAESERLEGQLAQFESRAAGRAELEAQRQSLQTERAGSGGTVAGATASIASAALQQRISQIIRESQGRLDSAQVLPEQPEGEFSRIGVRVTLEADMPALRQILWTVESGTPLLFVDNLQIRSRMQYLPSRARESIDPSLLVTFDVYGYRRPGERS